MPFAFDPMKQGMAPCRIFILTEKTWPADRAGVCPIDRVRIWSVGRVRVNFYRNGNIIQAPFLNSIIISISFFVVANGIAMEVYTKNNYDRYAETEGLP